MIIRLVARILVAVVIGTIVWALLTTSVPALDFLHGYLFFEDAYPSIGTSWPLLLLVLLGLLCALAFALLHLVPWFRLRRHEQAHG